MRWVRTVHKKLPKAVREKVTRRTVRERLAEFGDKPEEKIQKSDPGPVMMKKRLEFARLHLDKSPEEFYSARRFRFLLPLLVRYKQEDAPNHFKRKS